MVEEIFGSRFNSGQATNCTTRATMTKPLSKLSSRITLAASRIDVRAAPDFTARPGGKSAKGTA